MKKKEYSNAEVETLLREMAAAYRCTMEEALTARILSAVEDELRRGRRRLYNRSVQVAAAVAVLGAASFSVWNDSTPSVVAPSVTASDMRVAKPHQPALSDLDKTVTIASGNGSYLLGKPENPKCYGKTMPEIYYQFTACTDSL